MSRDDTAMTTNVGNPNASALMSRDDTAMKMTTNVGNPNASALSELKKSIFDMSTKLNNLYESITSTSLVASKSAGEVVGNTSPLIRPPSSYADIIASDIIASSLVKTVVSQTLKEQYKAVSVKSTLVVYGFPEEGADYDELLSMFDYMGCRCDIIQHTRLGRSMSNNQKNGRANIGRPIRVELNSPDSVDLVLSKARYLRQNNYYYGVNVDRWLSADELHALKSLRQRCRELNEISGVSTN